MSQRTIFGSHCAACEHRHLASLSPSSSIGSIALSDFSNSTPSTSPSLTPSTSLASALSLSSSWCIDPPSHTAYGRPYFTPRPFNGDVLCQLDCREYPKGYEPILNPCPVVETGIAVYSDREFAEAWERSRAICEQEFQTAGDKRYSTLDNNRLRVWDSYAAFIADDNLAKVNAFAICFSSGAVVSLQRRDFYFTCGGVGYLSDGEMLAMATKCPKFIELLDHASPYANDPIPIYADWKTFQSLVDVLVWQYKEETGQHEFFAPPMPACFDNVSLVDWRHATLVARSYGMEYALESVKARWEATDPARVLAMQKAEIRGVDPDNNDEQRDLFRARTMMLFRTILFALTGGLMGVWMVCLPERLHKPTTIKPGF